MSSFTSKFKSTPTFSFKSRTHSITSLNNPSKFPSPNLYTPEKVSLKKQPSVNFAKSKREEWKEIKNKIWTPGPGTHQLKTFTTDGPKKSISKFKPKQKPNGNPAPGTYKYDTAILQQKYPSFSMQMKSLSAREILQKMNNYKPSPNLYYQEDSKIKDGNHFSIGKSQRFHQNISSAKNPGPGQYNPETSFLKSVSTSSKCRMSKEKRKIDFSLGERSPGPGNYEKSSFIEENKKKSKGYSCRINPKRKNPLQYIPGPGKYQQTLNNKYRSSPLLKIPLSARPSFTQKKSRELAYIPGPGSHELSQQTTNQKFKSMSVHKFSKSKTNSQIINHKDLSHLSPSTYQVNNSILEKRSPKFSLDQKSKKGLVLEKLQKIPSPAEYQIKSMKSKSQVFKIPQSTRPNMIKHLMSNPGPGEYQQDEINSQGKKFKFSKAPRTNVVDDKIKKSKSVVTQSYEDRETFPNPPKYMGVKPKIQYHEKIMKKP